MNLQKHFFDTLIFALTINGLVVILYLFGYKIEPQSNKCISPETEAKLVKILESVEQYKLDQLK